MRWWQYAGRLLVALLCTAAIAVALLVGGAALALSIDWDLPVAREIGEPSSVFDRNGVPLARFAADVERRAVPLEQISPHLRDAVVATEDHRFYEHRGVDPLAVLRAVWHNVQTGGIVEGGSTLTQQYVKNTFVGTEVTLERKVREAVISIQLEKDLSKDQILERYLNDIYFGAGAYGAEAAALTYFGVRAADLTLSQAATLAGVLSQPSALNPRHDPEVARLGRNVVLEEMVRYSFRTRAEVDAALAEPLGLIEPRSELPYAPYFVEEVRRQMLEAFDDESLYRGGLVITTTLDVERQLALERRMLERLPPDGFEPGAVAILPSSGDVVAAWSGRDFTTRQVDVALRQDYGRPSGSTFKLFALATALEEGYTLDSRWPAPSQVTIGDWSPRGGGCGGSCTLRQATIRSINTVFAQVGNRVGVEDFTEMARRLGVTSTLVDHDLTQVLGTSSVTPLDLASAMATLANDGIACPARVVRSVTDAEGNPLPAPDPRQPTDAQLDRWELRMLGQGWTVPDEGLRLGEDGRCYRAVPRGVARTMHDALAGVVASGTGRRADIGRPQAGKTGTTTDNTQAWFVGYTPDLALAVMISHIDGDVPLRHIPGCGAACYGGDLPASLWADLAEALLDGVPPRTFPELGEDDGRNLPDRREVIVPARAPAPSRPQPAAGPVVPPPPTPADPGPTVAPTEPQQPTEPPPERPGGLTGEGGLLDELFDPD